MNKERNPLMKTISCLPARCLWFGCLLAGVLAVLMACSEEEDCSMNARPMLWCHFYHLNEESGRPEAVQLQTTLSVTAEGTDSVIVNRESNPKQLSLPLRYAGEETRLVLDYDNGTRYDTICIRHTNTPYYLSMDCGYQMKQWANEVEYTRHVIDSVHIANSELSAYEVENLKIFF